MPTSCLRIYVLWNRPIRANPWHRLLNSELGMRKAEYEGSGFIGFGIGDFGLQI